MRYSNIPIGDNAPKEVNTIIEIAMNAGPIKYEFDKHMESMVVDRFMNSSMQYPCNYGFVPHTLSGDGDPVDVLVYTNHPLATKSIIEVKPIGVLLTEDEKGQDEKILAVPTNRIDPYFAEINEHTDLPKILLKKIEHFFERYKDLEYGKWVKVSGWGDAKKAMEIIQKSIDRYKKEEV
ncbi:MAG: inorganic pyrophosphatase [Candidatus Midichloriaceae bacterium]|jgi:inorganic pyrophosphatase